MSLSSRSLLSWEPTASMVSLPPSAPSVSTTTPTAASTAPFFSAGQPYAQPESYLSLYEGRTASTLTTLNTSTTSPQEPPPLCGTLPYSDASAPTAGFPYRWIAGRRGSVRTPPRGATSSLRLLTRQTNAPMLMSADASLCDGPGRRSAQASSSPGLEEKRAASSTSVERLLERGTGTLPLLISSAGTAVAAAGVHADSLAAASAPGASRYSCCLRRSGVSFLQLVQARCKAATAVPQSSHTSRATSPSTSQPSASGCWCGGSGGGGAGGANTPTGPWKSFAVPAGPPTESATGHDGQREPHWTETFPLGGSGNASGPVAPGGEGGVTGGRHSGSRATAGRYGLYSSTGPATTRASASLRSGSATSSNDTSSRTRRFAGHAEEHAAVTPPALMHAERLVAERPTVSRRTSTAAAAAAAEPSQPGGERMERGFLTPPSLLHRTSSPVRSAAHEPTATAAAAMAAPPEEAERTQSESLEAVQQERAEEGEEEDTPRVDVSARPKTALPLGSSSHHSAAGAVFVSTSTAHGERALQFQDPVAAHTASSPTSRETHMRGGAGASLTQRERTRPPSLSDPRSPQQQQLQHRAASAAEGRQGGASPLPTLAVAGSDGSRSTHSSRSPAPTVESLSVGPCTSATASASSPLLSHPVAAARASCPCASLAASTRDAARHASAHASPSHVPVSPSAVSSPSLASPLVFHAMPTPPAAVSASSASAATGTLTDTSSRSGSTGPPGLPFPPRDASGAMGGGGGEGPSSGSTDGGAMESDGGDRHASPPPPISFSVLAASNSAASTAATPTADGGTPTTATTAAAAVFPLFGTTLQPCYQRTMHSRASSPVSTTPTAWLSATAHLPPPPPPTAALHFGPPAPGDGVGPPPPPSWQAPNTAAATARSAHSTFVSHPMPIPTAATSGLGLHSAAVPAGGVAGAGGGPPSRHSSLHSSPHQCRHGSPQSRAKAARSRHPAVEAAPANAAQSRLVPTDSAGRMGRMTDTGVLMVVPAGIAASWSAAVASSIVVAPNRFSWTTTVPPDAAFAMVEYRTHQADTKGGSTKDTIDTHDHINACEGARGGASAAAASPVHGLGERVVTYFPVHTEVLKKQSGYFSALFGDCGSPFVHSAPDEYVDLATLPQMPASSPQTRWQGGEKRVDGLGSHVEEEGKAGEKTTKEKADAPRRAGTHACCGSAAADDTSSSVSPSPSTSPFAATASVTGAAEAAPTTTRVPVYYIYWPGCDGDELTPPPPSVLEASCSAPGASARAAEAMDRDAPSLAVCCVAQLIHYLYTGALPIFHNCDDVKSASSGVLETADVCVFARQFAVLFAMSAYTSLSSLTQAMLNTLWRLLTVTHAVLPFWSVAGHMRLPDMRTLCEQWVEQHLCVFLHASTGRGLWRGLPLDQLQLLVAQRAAAIQAAVAAAAAAGGAAEGEEGEERGAEAAAAELAANAPVAVEEESSSPVRAREESASRSLEARPSLTTTGAAPRSYGWPTTGVALPQALMGSGDISSPLGRPRLSRHSSQADGIPSSTRASIPSGSSSSGGGGGGGGGSSHVTVVVQGTGTDGPQGGATAAAARATSPLRATRDSPPTPVTHPVAAMAPAGGRVGRRGSDAMAAALLSAPGTSARYLAFESPARSPAGAIAATPHPSNTHLHEGRLTHSLTSRGDHHSSSNTVVGGGGSNNSSRNDLANQSGLSVEASREGEASSSRADGADETTNSVAATAPDAAPPLIPHSAMPAAPRPPPLARPLASLWPLSEDRSSATSHARSPMLNSNVTNPHAVAITTSAVATRHSWHDSGAVRSSGSASAGTQSNRPLTFADVEPPGAVADTAAVRDEQRPALSNAAPMRSPTNSAGLQFAAIAAADAVPISRASSSLSNAAAPVAAAVAADANASTRPAPSPALSSSSSPAATSRSSSSVALQVSFANTGSSTSVTGARFAVDDSRSAAWPRSRNAPHTTPSTRHSAQPGVRRASTGAAPALTPFPSTGWMVVPPSLQLQADGAWRIGGYGRLYTVETREMLEERQSAWLRAEHEQRRDDRDVDDMYLSDAQLLVRLWTWWVARCEDVERVGGAPTEGEKVEVAAMLRRALTAEARESVEQQLRSAVTVVEVGDEESLSVGVLTPSMWRDVQRFLEDNPESVEMYALPL